MNASSDNLTCWGPLADGCPSSSSSPLSVFSLNVFLLQSLEEGLRSSLKPEHSTWSVGRHSYCQLKAPSRVRLPWLPEFQTGKIRMCCMESLGSFQTQHHLRKTAKNKMDSVKQGSGAQTSQGLYCNLSQFCVLLIVPRHEM